MLATRDNAEVRHISVAIAGTRRGRTSLKADRAKTARSLYALKKLYGSNEAVGKRIGLSAEMVREFISLLDLSSEALSFWETGRITSVDIGYRISRRIPKGRHRALAELVVKRNLTSKDVDAITSFMKQHPRLSAKVAVDRVLGSKDKTVYIAKYVIEPHIWEKFKKERVTKRAVWRHVIDAIRRAVGNKHIIECKQTKGVLLLKMDKTGYANLRSGAKRERVSLENFVSNIASSITGKEPQNSSIEKT